MNITIVSPGSKPNGPYLDLISEYALRINNTYKIHLRYPKADTAEQYLKYINPGDYIIALDEQGRQFSSLEFAKRLDHALSTSSTNIVFIIGGAYGLPEEIKKRSNLIWSFSHQVFPHQLFRIMLLEQIYRSIQIKNNTNYHH